MFQDSLFPNLHNLYDPFILLQLSVQIPYGDHNHCTPSTLLETPDPKKTYLFMKEIPRHILGYLAICSLRDPLEFSWTSNFLISIVVVRVVQLPRKPSRVSNVCWWVVEIPFFRGFCTSQVVGLGISESSTVAPENGWLEY